MTRDETAAERDKLREINAELLKALVHLLAVDVASEAGYFRSDRHDAQYAARAAIARATGGQP